MQFQLYILDVNIYIPKVVEITALGAAYLAGLAVGSYENKEDIKKFWIIDKEFTPNMNEEKDLYYIRDGKEQYKDIYNV